MRHTMTLRSRARLPEGSFDPIHFRLSGSEKDEGMDDGRRAEPRWRYIDFVTFSATSASGVGHLANVSGTGVFVRTDCLLRPGESVQISLRGPRPTIQLDATVRWVGSRSDGSEGFGAQLVDPSPAYLELVRSVAPSDSSEDGVPRRVAPRFILSIPVAVEFGTTCDDGTLCDISLSGARLEDTGVHPTEGSQVTLTFALPGYSAFEIVARVVRPTPSGGYAVQFEAINSNLKEALASASTTLRSLPDSSGGL